MSLLETLFISFVITSMVTLITSVFAVGVFRLGMRGTAWLRTSILTNVIVVCFLLGNRWNGFWGGVFLVFITQAGFWASAVLVSRSLFPLKGLRDWQQAIFTLVAFIFDFHHTCYVVERGKVEARIPGQMMPRWGSGVLLADVGNAAVIQTSIQHKRVLGPGVHFMQRFEKVRTAVDLHNQMRLAKIDASTKDGVPFQVVVFCLFRINPGDDPVAGTFPYDPDIVRQVVYGQEGLPVEEENEDEQQFQWDDYALGVVISSFREIVARFQLDQLFEPNAPGQVQRQIVTSLLNTAVEQKLTPRGIQNLWAGYGTLEFSDKVVDQRIKSWQAEWTARAESRRAMGAAAAEEQVETAWASAQYELVQGLINSLSAAQGLAEIDPADLISWHLLNSVEGMSTDPLTQPIIPQETMDTMLSIRQWLATPGEP